MQVHVKKPGYTLGPVEDLGGGGRETPAMGHPWHPLTRAGSLTVFSTESTPGSE